MENDNDCRISSHRITLEENRKTDEIDNVITIKMNEEKKYHLATYTCVFMGFCLIYFLSSIFFFKIVVITYRRSDRDVT